MALTKQIKYIGDFADEAAKRHSSWGSTRLYSTGISGLDTYLGGGYGRADGYEIVLLFGQTGIGKSTVALNFIAEPIKAGKKIGLLILEDDMADASLRLQAVLGDDYYAKMNSQRNVVCIPENAMAKSWNLDDLLELIEMWFTKLNIDIILLDHLQFAFEGAESIKGENEYIAQRIFMQKLNALVKNVNKTIILVSHVNKGIAKGMDKIVGSGAIAQAATKVIEVSKKDVFTQIYLRKSRFTATPDHSWDLLMKSGKLRGAD